MIQFLLFKPISQEHSCWTKKQQEKEGKTLDRESEISGSGYLLHLTTSRMMMLV